MNDNEIDVGAVEEQPLFYLFNPSASKISSFLPKVMHVVPEDFNLTAGLPRFKSQEKGQEGVICPGCHNNYTKYKGFQKASSKYRD